MQADLETRTAILGVPASEGQHVSLALAAAEVDDLMLRPQSARWSAHSAFEDPTSPPNARPRKSIEIRTLAFF